MECGVPTSLVSGAVIPVIFYCVEWTFFGYAHHVFWGDYMAFLGTLITAAKSSTHLTALNMPSVYPPFGCAFAPGSLSSGMFDSDADEPRMQQTNT